MSGERVVGQLLLKKNGLYQDVEVAFDLDRGKFWLHLQDGDTLCIEAPRLRGIVARYDQHLAESGLPPLTEGRLPAMSRRCEFRRYDHRRGGVASSRGWLHYAALSPVLFVVGFHRGWRYRKRRHPASACRYPSAWIELTLYLGQQTFAVYRGVRVPEAWL